MPMKVRCPYCGEYAEFVDSAEVYGRSYGMIYLCRPCDARVGVHNGTEKPFGTLANAELRALRKRAHAAFDPIWEQDLIADITSIAPQKKPRTRAYWWLAFELGIPAANCHIGSMNEEQCRKLIDICKEARQRCQKTAP